MLSGDGKRGTIGIVGGVGPRAGLDLYGKILSETLAVRDQDHPSVILVSFSEEITDRTDYLLGREQRSPAGGIVRVIGRLARAGATVVGIPCHTAHSPRIREEIEAGMEQGSWGVKLLSLVHLAAAYVARTTASGGKVGILATTGTVMSGVYDAPCREQGLRPVYPSGDVQVRLVHPAIYDPLYGIKARSHPVTDQATKLVEGAVDHLIERGVDCVLLACTELPLAYPQAFRETTRIVDATRVLARALVREVAPLQLRDDLG